MARTTSYPRRRPNKDVEVGLRYGYGLRLQDSTLRVHPASNGHISVTSSGVSIDAGIPANIETLKTKVADLEARVAALEEA